MEEKIILNILPTPYSVDKAKEKVVGHINKTNYFVGKKMLLTNKQGKKKANIENMAVVITKNF